jgi:hypothetical protein
LLSSGSGDTSERKHGKQGQPHPSNGAREPGVPVTIPNSGKLIQEFPIAIRHASSTMLAAPCLISE